MLTANGKASFKLNNFHFAGATCTATESEPLGYRQVEAAGCDSLLVEYGNDPSCTMVNDVDSTTMFFSGFEAENNQSGCK